MMRNRYGDEYTFERVDENTFTITGNLKYWRFGGKEDQETLDESDLGFVDPSGGPFIGIGYEIEGRPVVKISAGGDLDGSPRILFGVK
jgi:hypothetical protein